MKRIMFISAVLAAAAAAVMPIAASAQGVPGGVERGSREGERAAGPVGAVLAGSSEVWSVASMGCSVSTSDLASTATLLSETTPPTHIKAMCGSAQTFQVIWGYLLRRAPGIRRYPLPIYGCQWTDCPS